MVPRQSSAFEQQVSKGRLAFVKFYRNNQASFERVSSIYNTSASHTEGLRAAPLKRHSHEYSVFMYVFDLVSALLSSISENTEVVGASVAAGLLSAILLPVKSVKNILSSCVSVTAKVIRLWLLCVGRTKVAVGVAVTATVAAVCVPEQTSAAFQSLKDKFSSATAQKTKG